MLDKQQFQIPIKIGLINQVININISNKGQVCPSVIETVPVPALNIKESAVKDTPEWAVDKHEADEGEHEEVSEPLMLVCVTLNDWCTH